MSSTYGGRSQQRDRSDSNDMSCAPVNAVHRVNSVRVPLSFLIGTLRRRYIDAAYRSRLWHSHDNRSVKLSVRSEWLLAGSVSIPTGSDAHTQVRGASVSWLLATRMQNIDPDARLLFLQVAGASMTATIEVRNMQIMSIMKIARTTSGEKVEPTP